MKNKVIIACAVVLSFFLGIGTTYLLIRFVPITKEILLTGEKEVTINEKGISDSVEKIYDSVVVITSSKDDDIIGSGTGFMYKKENDSVYIITNNHVVSDGNKFNVIFNDGEKLEGVLMAGDVFADIAVIKIKANKDMKIASLGTGKDLRLGDTVFTVGAPVGSQYSGTVTRGIISGLDRLVSISLGNSNNDWIMKVIQTDAAINPGNSGGPLVNSNGEVIGVNTLKLVKDEIEGIGFALPIEDVMKAVEILEKGNKIERPFFGIGLLDLDDKLQLYQLGIVIDGSVKKGVVVSEVTSDSPASKIGLKSGDVVIEVNGVKIEDKATFRYELYKYTPNEEITIKYIRDKKELSAKVKLEKAK